MKKKLKLIYAYFLNFKLMILYFFKRKNDIKICISTTKGYADKTIPSLIQSLVNNKVKIENIFVFEGGHKNYFKNKTTKYNHYYVDHNSFDLTSLISIIELKIFANHWLLLHDTIEIDNSFKYKFFTLSPSKFDCMPLNIFPSMNIGVYSHRIIEKEVDFILSQKNTKYNFDKLQDSKREAIKNEDYIFNRALNKKYINTRLKVFSHSQIVNYKNKLRLREYYAQLGIFKYKANYQEERVYVITL